MADQATISKWGNSLAIRIPQGVLKLAQLTEGDALNVELQQDGSILLRSPKKKYKLDDLVSQITKENRHSEVDWGKPVGKEAW